jgi:beta-glucanase (GH16 family)
MPGAVSDEFDGAAGNPPDPNLWGYDTGGGWPTGEAQTYTSSPANVYQDGNGHLVIRAIKSDNGYTSGRIKTQNNLTMGYGRVEASIQMPPGPGILPAFWLLGSNYPSVGHPQCGEIDIIEYVRSAFHHTLHGPQKGEADYRPPGMGEYSAVSRSEVPSFDPSAGFHTYWVERSPDVITIGVDSTTTAVFTPHSLPEGATWVFNDQPMFAVLNFAVGDGGWAGTPPEGTAFPQEMVIDWFRYTPA